MESKKYTKSDILEIKMENICKANAEDHKNILQEIEIIKTKLDEAFVTRLEFDPVKRIAYGLVASLVTIVLTILTIAIKFALER